jgi:poly(3-hydroxyalkanoate) synthetase
MDWLETHGFDPWLLDWRGSGLVVDALKGQAVLRDCFDFDRAAEYDVPAALSEIRDRTKCERIAAVGHCMGAATLAQAIAAGHVGPDKGGLTHVVLLTLGLFYEPAWDSRVKSGDYVLERLWSAGVDSVDPRPTQAWPL